MSYELIEQHYRIHHDKLVKRMARRAGTEWAAEDIIQEAYTRALKYVNSYNPEYDIGQWLSTILNNCLREYKNLEKGYSPMVYEEDEQEGLPSEDFPRHVMREVYELISVKSAIQQEVLGLYFKQEYSAKDISEITPHKYKTVHQIINRFRQELRELYG